MEQLEIIQKRLKELVCPICKKSGFSLNPRAESGYAETIYKARCNQCAYIFPVSTPTRPIKETNPDVDLWLRGLTCPSCQKRGAEFNFRCTPSVRESVYFVTCLSCRHPFLERAPMEAYE